MKLILYIKHELNHVFISFFILIIILVVGIIVLYIIDFHTPIYYIILGCLLGISNSIIHPLTNKDNHKTS